MKLPETRNRNLVISELDKELLIYDLDNNKAYCLNETSAIVFNACGEGQTFDDLRRDYNFTDDLVYFALDGLQKTNLIENEKTSYFAGFNRREVIRKVGLASMVALPVIAQMVAPKAIQAASGCINAGGALANAAVATTITNPSNDTTTNQNVAAQQLRRQCCSNSYRDFISNGCSSGQGQICQAQAICN